MPKFLEMLTADLAASLKKKDRVRVETLRFLLAAIRNSAISKYGNQAEEKLTDADISEVIKKQVKTHKESIAAFEKGRRADLVEKEKGELAILESYLPSELTDEELKKILEPIVASGEKNFGLLMKQAMSAVEGRADGGRVATLLKQML